MILLLIITDKKRVSNMKSLLFLCIAYMVILFYASDFSFSALSSELFLDSACYLIIVLIMYVFDKLFKGIVLKINRKLWINLLSFLFLMLIAYFITDLDFMRRINIPNYFLYCFPIMFLLNDLLCNPNTNR